VVFVGYKSYSFGKRMWFLLDTKVTVLVRACGFFSDTKVMVLVRDFWNDEGQSLH
jgi:hypothetical protein